MKQIDQHMNMYLDNLFECRALHIKNQLKDKKCAYKLNALHYTVSEDQNGLTGICVIKNVRYSHSLDCNIYDIELEDGASLSVCEFEIYLKELE